MQLSAKIVSNSVQIVVPPEGFWPLRLTLLVGRLEYLLGCRTLVQDLSYGRKRVFEQSGILFLLPPGLKLLILIAVQFTLFLNLLLRRRLENHDTWFFKLRVSSLWSGVQLLGVVLGRLLIHFFLHFLKSFRLLLPHVLNLYEIVVEEVSVLFEVVECVEMFLSFAGRQPEG